MADIFIHDEFDPEAIAMMQALYSRSPESVAKHADKVKKSGSSRFMESYYIGYGHASIGDCGTTTLFFEGVSILAAKAIQDNPLYSGQETSTRYIDFSKQEYVDPLGTNKSKSVIEKWVGFYTNSMTPLVEYLSALFPYSGEDSEATWKKAISARAFDILRGYLPSGMTTQLSWTTNLRQAHENLYKLRFHPLKEIRDLSIRALAMLKEKYPSSFSHKERVQLINYYDELSTVEHYPVIFPCPGDQWSDKDVKITPNFSVKSLPQEWIRVLKNRPKGGRLPRYLSRFGSYNVKFLLDFGSFRDLQRHRNGICPMPLLSGSHGFNSWYLNQLPVSLRFEAEQLIASQEERISNLISNTGLNQYEAQYFWPMGYNVQCELSYDLPEMIYVAELRSSSTVHPTLRKIANEMGKYLSAQYPDLKLYCDYSDDNLDVRRGAQDIVKKDA